MSETIIAIAMLCQINTDSNYMYMRNKQNICQKELIQCVLDSKYVNLGRALAKCVVERQL